MIAMYYFCSPLIVSIVFEVVQNMNMTFNKVSFILAFTIGFWDRTLQLQSLRFVFLSQQNYENETEHNISQLLSNQI